MPKREREREREKEEKELDGIDENLLYSLLGPIRYDVQEDSSLSSSELKLRLTVRKEILGYPSARAAVRTLTHSYCFNQLTNSDHVVQGAGGRGVALVLADSLTILFYKKCPLCPPMTSMLSSQRKKCWKKGRSGLCVCVCALLNFQGMKS